MFVTYPYFKLPYQFDLQSTNWHSLEVVLRHSWFMASIEVASDGNDTIRTFLISSPIDLIEIAKHGAGGHLVGVSLVIAPSSYEDIRWRMVTIKRLGQLAPRDEEPSELILTDCAGIHYTGFPLANVTIPDRPVLELAHFD